jgi:putative hydrolases of HD superfamily
MEEKIYRKNLVPLAWQSEMRLFTENEFDGMIIKDGKRMSVKSDEISQLYNENQYHPRDGEIVKASDDLNAYIEAYLAKLNGSPSPEFDRAMETVSGKYTPMTVSGIAFKDIYSQFVC